MKKAIVGKKIGMTQVFTDDGRLVPVTVVEAGPCKVVQKKTTESDGYDAVQVGFDTYAENRAKKLVNKPLTGHFKKAGVAPTRYLREFRLDRRGRAGSGQRADRFSVRGWRKDRRERREQGPRLHRRHPALESAYRPHGPRLQVSPWRRLHGRQLRSRPACSRTSTCPATTAWSA